MDYLVQSRCPFTSICLESKCTVVCPGQETIDFHGEVIGIKPEMDGSILTVKEGENTYEVLASIPNLGRKYAPAVKNIEIGSNIRVIGTKIRFKDNERIIASQIYVDEKLQ
ncbi:MAG: hypothetical protein GF416_07670 [Candidatus Altiarchaeales archaeon]|nr:hypothetical protein [Candidatus Altiarchaeales archaeon]MBD3416990.1 hypothetical protein [Candidatus Altiarchaeales archaeon]